jgi:putative FmdB family regulatory protein
MPTYEYECKKCGHNFEVFQSMSDEPLKHCVKCGNEVRRLIFGGAGIIFKGSGFYVTDKASGKTSDAGKAADTGKGKKAGGETKTEQTTSSPAASDASKPAPDTSKDAATSKAKPSTQTT